MIKNKYCFPSIFFFLFFLFYYSKTSAQQFLAKPEFRGVWIATVNNIDWPSNAKLSSEEQQESFKALLDMHKRNGINAVIVQVRPSADAFYPSTFEPWSQWLTGKQGKPPSPYYDPLEFMIREAHKRGMDFHAWMNPFRAVFNISTSILSPTHISRIHPEWFITYGNQKYFDPANKEVHHYITLLIKDIVKRYDIDAIHLDDYFYPYPIAGKAFPDYEMYKEYGNGMDRNDWRRSNVDSIIAKISRAIKEENKKCLFGISPFGVWRNVSDDIDGSNTNTGITNYDHLYADILLWLKNDWIDYVAPQLYWEFSFKRAPFDVLVDWWSTHSYGKKCYIGIGIYRAGSNGAWRDKTQIPKQIKKIRATPNIQGMIFYNSSYFEKNTNGWGDSLRLNYFKEYAPPGIK